MLKETLNSRVSVRSETSWVRQAAQGANSLGSPNLPGREIRKNAKTRSNNILDF